mgnify:CR=1 FL=1
MILSHKQIKNDMFCNTSLILFHIYLSVDKPELMAVGQFHRWNFRYRPTQILSKVTNNYKKKAFGSEAKCSFCSYLLC